MNNNNSAISTLERLVSLRRDVSWLTDIELCTDEELAMLDETWLHLRKISKWNARHLDLDRGVHEL
jgi:hypothetical protein